eukprot:scaffold108472_cov53-Attheya_sp.AAC.2
MKHLVDNKRDAIDIAIMKLAVNEVRVYLPLQGWPQVFHDTGVSSSRRQHDRTIVQQNKS